MNNNLKAKCRFKNGLLDGKRYNGTVYKIKSFIWVKQDDKLALMEVLDFNFGSPNATNIGSETLI